MNKKLLNIVSGFQAFRALQYRNYSLFFFGQGISLIGTWMQRITIGWLVYRLTQSALMLGTVSFATQIPTLILAPLAGVLADRLDKHKLLVVTQILSMLQALTMAVLVLSDRIEVWHIVVLGSCLGIINAFDMPVRQSFIIDMIEDKKDLGNAIALNSSLVNGGKILGPSIAGVLIMFLGEGMCFLVNALSYIAVIFALLSMKVVVVKAFQPPRKMWVELQEGYRYAIASDTIRSVLMLVAVLSFFAMPYISLMPIFASAILHGGPDTLGYLMFANGTGSLIASVFLTTRSSQASMARIIVFAAFALGCGLVVFSLSTTLWLSTLVIVMVGFGMMLQSACSNTLLQTFVEDNKRGRIMSFYTMANMGITPFGNLVAGFFANELGVNMTILCCGSCCIIGSIVFAWHAKVTKMVDDESKLIYMGE